MGTYAEYGTRNCAYILAIDPAVHAWWLNPGNGAAISLKGWDHCTIILWTGTWAGDTNAVTVTQDVSVTPTSPQALVFTEYYTNAANTGSSTLAQIACAGTFDMDTSNAVYVIEIDGDELDTLNRYDCLSVVVTDAVKHDNPYAALYVLTKGRHRGAPGTIMDATID